MVVHVKKNDSPLLIAHRGESVDAPENTLAAFDLAWKLGDDAIELDVHLSADGQIVVCHDANTLRTGGEKLVIKDQSLAALQALDVGIWKGLQWAEQRLTTLENVLDKTPAGKVVFVEVKPADRTAAVVVELFRRRRWAGVEVRLISFHFDVVRQFKRDLPGMAVYWLVEPKADRETNRVSPSIDEIIAAVQAAGLDGIDIKDGPWISASSVQRMRESGLAVSVWTVDDPARCRELVELEVDAITTNRAAWMRGLIF